MKARIFVWVYIAGALLGTVMMSCGVSAQTSEYGLHTTVTDVVWQKLINRKDPLQPDIPKEGWGDHVAIEPKMVFLKYGFFDSSWYFDSAYQKVQEVGLKVDAGFHIGPWFDILYNHRSVHSADSFNSYGQRKDYELMDAIGIRIHITP